MPHKVTSQIVWTPFGDGWARGIATVAAGARPAHTADHTLGYDAESKQWINIYADNLGAYGVLKSADAPTATTVTYTDAFPVDPADGPTVLAMTPSVVIIDSQYTLKGRAVTSHEVYTKQ